MKDELDQPGAVPQVDEDQAAVVAAPVHPARDAGLGVDAVVEDPAAPGVAVGVRRAVPAAQLIAVRSDASSEQFDDLDQLVRPRRVLRGDTGQRQRPVRQAQDVLRAHTARVFQLALDTAAGQVDLSRDADPPQLSGERRRRPPVVLALGDDEDVALGGFPLVLPLQGEQDSLDPGRPADGRRGRPAQLLDQAVVAPTAADLRLGAELVADEREGGPRVVVEASHQSRVDSVLDPHGVEQGLDLLEMGRVLLVEGVEDRRGGGHHIPRALVLGVEGAQRVRLDSLPDGLAQRLLVLAQVALQSIEVGPPRRERAEAPQPQLDSGHREGGEEVVEQDDRLGVGERRVGADHLGADLVELPEAARLGALVAEEGPDVEELHRLRQFVHPVLDVGAADRRRALGSQGDAAPALVLEGEHLLLDDVGRAADAAHEEVGVLEGGRGNLRVAGQVEDRLGDVLDGRARDRLARQHVERPARCLVLARHDCRDLTAGGRR